MPLTGKGKEILGSMEHTYKDPAKAKQVFYASANKGTIEGVHNDRRTSMSDGRNLGGPGGLYKSMVTQKGSTPPPPPKPAPKDVVSPDPATGPMSTKGPVGTSEGLPKTITPDDHMRDSTECGKAMSLDAIKAAGKRIGKY